MKKTIVCLVMLAALTAAIAQQPAGNLQPNEIQQLKLENAQLKAKLAAAALVPAQREYQEKLNALLETCELVKTENHWDKSVQCDPTTLKFSAPQKPAVTPQPPAAPSPSPQPEKK